MKKEILNAIYKIGGESPIRDIDIYGEIRTKILTSFNELVEEGKLKKGETINYFTYMFNFKKDYGQLYDLLCSGDVVTCWIEKDNKTAVAEAKTNTLKQISISVKDVGYIEVGVAEKEEFINKCTLYKLKYV